jgi:nucleotide-binding universal stress UspA family protein
MIPPNDDETARRALSENARWRLAELVARHACGGLTVEVLVTVGHPHVQIERAARANVALTVMGVRSSRAALRFFFGSTARQVLRSGVTPLMLVPHRAGVPRDHQREEEEAVASS